MNSILTATLTGFLLFLGHFSPMISALTDECLADLRAINADDGWNAAIAEIQASCPTFQTFGVSADGILTVVNDLTDCDSNSTAAFVDYCEENGYEAFEYLPFTATCFNVARNMTVTLTVGDYWSTCTSQSCPLDHADWSLEDNLDAMVNVGMLDCTFEYLTDEPMTNDEPVVETPMTNDEPVDETPMTNDEPMDDTESAATSSTVSLLLSVATLLLWTGF